MTADMQLAHLTPEELANPYSCLLNPTSYDQLVAAHDDYLTTAPAQVDELEGWIQAQVPSVAACYARDPSIPPLFNTRPILAALPNAPNFDAPTNVLFLVLGCLPFSPPRNVHPLDPRSPAGPTVDYVLAFLAMLFDLSPAMVLVVHVRVTQFCLGLHLVLILP